MHLLVTGGTGVLGRAFRPLAEAEGHHVSAPGRADLDLFDPVAVARAMVGADAVLHLATRIQPLDQLGNPRRGARTIACGQTPRDSWWTRRSRPTAPFMCSRPSPSCIPQRAACPRKPRS